jgi:hypothetical protein
VTKTIGRNETEPARRIPISDIGVASSTSIDFVPSNCSQIPHNASPIFPEKPHRWYLGGRAYPGFQSNAELRDFCVFSGGA